MQCVDHKMRLIDEVPTNSVSKEIATEVPIRMNIVLPPCKVRLNRLTEKEIHQRYPNTSDDSAVNKAIYYNEHNYSQSALLENTKRYTFREFHNANSEYFALYKRKRKHFIDRRYGVSVNSSVLMHSDESNTDMSEDEFRNQSIQGKGKKRVKKGKYELDSPWNPTSTKIHSVKRLRRQVRRPVIDSDSSSTDEEEILYNSFVSGDSNSTNSAFQSTVPSDENNGLHASSSSFNKIAFCKDSLDSGNAFYPENKKGDNEDVINTNSLPSTSENSDIVSGIIEQMNNCAGIKGNIKSLSSDTVNRVQTQNYIKPQLHKRKKLKKLCNDPTSSIVNQVVQGIVNKICMQHKPLLKQSNKKFSKKCLWCNTQFSSNNSNETMCVICYDQGKSKYVHNSLTKTKISKSQKQVSGNKVKKISSTMCRVLKKLPKTEMQRLMYVEKSGKLNNEKGYNHCKSFNAPKYTPDAIDLSGINQEATTSRNSNNGQNKDKPKKSILAAKKKMSVSNLDTINNMNSIKNNSERKSDFQSGSKSTNSKKNKEKVEAISEKKNKISLKKFNEGLFVMSFPDPDEELNINITGEHLNIPESVKQANTENSFRLNGSRAAKPSDKSVKRSKNLKKSPSVENNEEYKTFLLPPVSTIVIANYSNKNDKDGNFRLSTVFYQNQYTLQHANSNCTKHNGNFPDLHKPPSCNISNENLSPNLQNNGSLSAAITTLNNANQVQPVMSNSSPSLVTNSTTNNTIPLLPVVSSVISLSEQPCQINEDTSLPFPTDNNFVNSEQLPFKITHVISEKAPIISGNSCIKNNKNADKINPSSENSEVIRINKEISAEKNSAKLQKISLKRRSSESEKNAKKVNDFSDTNVPENSGEAVTLNKNTEVNIKSTDDVNKVKVITTTQKQDKNVSDPNKKNSRHEQNINANKTENEQISNVNDRIGRANVNSGTQPVKLVESDENASVPDPIKTAIDLLGAISVLGVIDLESNPLSRLTANVELTKEKLTRLCNEKTVTPEITDAIALAHYNLKVFDIAYKYLTTYGSFAKVIEHFMRKHKFDEMIQIKKERINDDDDDEDKEAANQSSCQFSEKSQSTTQLNTETFSNTSETMSPSPLTLKMENVSSCLKEQDSTPSHIEKLQSQIAAMNNAQISYDAFQSGGVVHHYAYTPAVNAPAPVTPRNDCMGGESRETPSRGSGPRTPARPESATSQPDEQSFALQVKRELSEVTAASPVQNSYTQNSNVLSTQLYDRIPAIRDGTLNSGAQSVLNNALQQISVTGTVNPVYTTQPNFKLQSKDIVVNRNAIDYNSGNKQSCTNVLLNITPETQNITSNMNTNINQSRQVLFGSPLYISNGTGIPQEQAVPSINNNQYVLQQPFSAPNVLVNNSQVGSQNGNALLTNVSNHQFYTNTTNQITPLYYPPQASQNAMQTTSASLVQNQPAAETMEQMYCAVCKKVATLRCKQCAKVAYCNTTCARAYWQERHKMECKPLPS